MVCNAFEKSRQRGGVAQLLFVGNGQGGETLPAGAGKEPEAVCVLPCPWPMHRDPHAAGRRAGLEDQAANSLARHPVQPLRDPDPHPVGQVLAGGHGQQLRIFRVSLQLHGLAGDAQAAFRLRAERHQHNVSGHKVQQPLFQPVAAVVAGILAEETGADADCDVGGHGGIVA